MLRRVVLALALVGLSACDNGDATRPIEVEGDYQLLEPNGEPLPYDHFLGCCIYTAGSLALENIQYEIAITFQNKTNDIVATVTERGTYSLDGSAIDFEPTAGDAPLSLYDGQVQGNTITLALGGDGPGAEDQFRAVFQK